MQFSVLFGRAISDFTLFICNFSLLPAHALPPHSTRAAHHDTQNRKGLKKYSGFDFTTKTAIESYKNRNHSENTVIIKKADNCENNLTNYRLCVLASGSLITDIFSCRTLISVSCLHFGQNNGKFSRIVSPRILMRVLFLHTGHNSHSI